MTSEFSKQFVGVVWLNFWLFVQENRHLIFCIFAATSNTEHVLGGSVQSLFNLCDLSLYVYFHWSSSSFSYLESAFVQLVTQVGHYETFGFLWLKAGSAILHCFLHLKVGTFNTSSFYLVIHCSITVILLNSQEFLFLSKLFFPYMHTLVKNKH